MDRRGTLREFILEIGQHLLVLYLCQKTLAVRGIQQESLEIKQGQVQFGQSQKAVAQQPDHTGSAGGIDSPNLHHDIGEKESQPGVGDTLSAFQRIKRGHPFGIARIENNDPLPDLRP